VFLRSDLSGHEALALRKTMVCAWSTASVAVFSQR
jgi:hypothetical protein